MASDCDNCDDSGICPECEGDGCETCSESGDCQECASDLEVDVDDDDALDGEGFGDVSDEEDWDDA